jgi:hypothetical protein
VRKTLLLKLCVALAISMAFIAVFKLLQNPTIYTNTLGKISSNYERSNADIRYHIHKVKKPFVAISEANAYNWDTRYYKNIRDSLYQGTDRAFADRYAFYPMFPLVWKVSGIRSIMIIPFNYILFVLALILLSGLLMKDNDNKLFIFSLGLLLPSVIVFYLPYAESVFVLGMALALWGLFKKRYWLYVAGALMFTLARPAEMIFVVAVLVTDGVYFMRHKDYRYFIKELCLKLIPLLAGNLIIFCMQYYYSDSWSAYFDTWDLWPKESGYLNPITDWSTEGFGMTVFAIFFVALPCLIYSCWWGIKSLGLKGKLAVPSLFAGGKDYIKEYMFNVSAVFMVGVIMYTILTSGNVLNGFFRYSMNTPFFYVLFFLLPAKLTYKPVKYLLSGYIAAVAAIAIFLSTVHYAGNLLRFDYAGLFLSLPVATLYVFGKWINDKFKAVFFIILIIPVAIWYAYLFNMYLSNVWIFT